MQLDQLVHHHFGQHITEFPRILDWGCGCARVMRQFWETAVYVDLPRIEGQDILGQDIDEVNIDWCQRHLSGFGRYRILGLDGFKEPDASIDLLYGISVMTHLTELNQQLWLDEIARIVKPGGCVLLTTHGEYATYRLTDSIVLPFVERFGFFDAMPDAAIGAHRETYYRATFQSRAHVRETWTRHFDVLDVVPAANSFIQDFIVLRRR
jgi:SAM-dependent methyltransferase